MRVTLKMEGLKELDEALGELSKATAKNVLRRAGRQALQPMADVAQAATPDDPETPQKIEIVIAEKAYASRWSGVVRGDATVTLFMGPTRESYPEAGVQEFGSPPHVERPRKTNLRGRLAFVREGRFYAPKQVNHPGVAPVGYMRRAWEGGKEQLLSALVVLIGAEIEKARQRAARKAARLASRG